MELLKMKGIEKAFFEHIVLSDVSLHVNVGEVHALLGENGAGKSTLMNILAGVYKRDKGDIIFEGKPLSYSSIKDSENAGIAFVHQELNIFNDLKVFENIFLGKEIVTKYGRLDKKRMIKESFELLDSLGVDIDPLELADNIETSKKQLIEIAKAFHTEAKLIILDEPTTALNTNEIAHFFEIISNMKKLGKSFIFISHKMPEIFEIADRYTVLRNGLMISTGDIKDTTPEGIAKDMVGKSYSNKDFYESRNLSEVILELKNFTGDGFKNVNFSVRKGEIVGITGLKGAGCSEVMQTIFGARSHTAGKIFVKGKEIPRYTIKGAMKAKIAMVASNRKENSILPDMNLMENTYVSKHSIDQKFQHIFKKREQDNFEGYKQLLNIKAQDPMNLITSLSGGNQQKVILARWLNTDAEILLFDNPTQGIDVGAKNEIYKLILDLSKKGKTIIMNTLEVPEIQKIADRCVVFYHGEIVAELEHNQIDEEAVMLYATNAANASQQVVED